MQCKDKKTQSKQWSMIFCNATFKFLLVWRIEKSALVVQTLSDYSSKIVLTNKC